MSNLYKRERFPSLGMIPVEEIYPDLKGQDSFYGPGDYNPLVESLGFTVLLVVEDKDYQGDSRYLLKDLLTGHIGFLQFGWGSCSGCDSLQACTSFKEIQDLREELYTSVQWGKPTDMLKYFKNHDWKGDYSYHQEEQREFITKAIEKLEEVIRNG